MATTWIFGAKLLTMREAARFLHVHENTLRRWCDQGVITAFRVGSRGDRRFVETDLENLKKRLRENGTETYKLNQ